MDLFSPIKITRKVKTNIDKFETLSLTDGTPVSRPGTAKSKISIIDLSSEGSEGASDTFSLRKSEDSSLTSQSTNSHQSNHKRHESQAFLQKSYLKEVAPASLPDDAREILKGQPEVEDLAAVLQYLQYGIEGKHDFNVRVPGPKASQIINVLVTITIPDLWQPLQQRRLSTQHAKLKTNLLASLTSVAGLGALLMQIKRLSATNTGQQVPLLVDTVTVLVSVLTGSQVLSTFLSDAIKITGTEAQRVVFWQEVTSLFAGSKVFSAMAQVFVTHPDLEGLPESKRWIGDGVEYSKWLAKNISAIAIDATAPTTGDNQQLKMLSQVLKRALNLGYRGKLPCLRRFVTKRLTCP